MSEILVDTSVWINFFNNHDLPQVSALKSHLRSSSICLCPPIVQEVLQGLRNDVQFQQTKEMLLTLEIFISDPLYVAVEAAELFRSLRKKGVTIRKPNDCIIAWYAIKNKVKLLHNDSDFELIAKHSDLELA